MEYSSFSEVFETYNYNGVDSTWGYAGQTFPFYFKFPQIIDSIDVTYKDSDTDGEEHEIVPVSKKRILWDFGDGTTFLGLSQSHYYTNPGRYEVKCYFYDQHNQMYQNSFTNYITVTDVVENSIEIDFTDTGTYTGVPIEFDVYQTVSMLNQSIVGDYSNIKIIPSLDCELNNTNWNWYETGQSTEYLQWTHLKPSIRFLSGSGVDQYVADKFTTDWTPLYLRLPITDGIALTTEQNDCFAGLSGVFHLSLVADTPLSGHVWVTLDAENLMQGAGDIKEIKQIGSQTPQFLNLTQDGFVLSGITYSDLPKTIEITSNGIGTAEDTFRISDNKFVGYDFSQVAQIHLSSNDLSPALYLPGIPLSCVSLVYPNGTVVDNYTITKVDPLEYGGHPDLGGNIRMVVNLSAEPLSSIKLKVDHDDFGTFYSNSINVVDRQKTITKINEDFDIQDYFREIRTQQTLFDKTQLYEYFFPQLLGDSTSDETQLGKKLYEKIQNFTQNRRDLDTMEIDAIKDAMQMIETTDFTSPIYLPEQVKRMMNILSIKKSTLIGNTNKNEENLRRNGYIISPTNAENKVGSNLGSEINPNVYVFDINVDNYIVAYERFSENYRIINTNFYADTNYDLSALSSWNLTTTSQSILQYQDNWGWGLILPDAYLSSDIPKYYKFYRFVPGEEGTSEQYIDFANERNEFTRDEILSSSFVDDIKLSIQELFTKNIE